MKCRDCKFKCNVHGCVNACEECIYKNVKYINKPCSECGGLRGLLSITGCNFTKK